jgi:DNA polymerase-3 subunit gamma/tau
MLLSQQARLTRIDSHRAVVQVSGNWMGMVQSRAALLEKAIASAMGGNRQLVLENHGGAAPMAAMPSTSAPKPAQAPSSAPSNGAQLPSPPQPSPPQSAAVLPGNGASPAPPSATTSAPPPVSAAPSMTTGQTPAVPTPTGHQAVTGEPTTSSPVRPEPSARDEKVKRFADFFNGQVLDVDLNN